MTTAADITVVTLTIPGREDLLIRNLRSVYDQTERPHAHLILAEANRQDVGKMYNEIVRGVTTEWLAFLDDDNYLLRHHFATILPEMDDADVVYSWESSATRPRVNANLIGQQEFGEWQERENLVDNSCAVRTSRFRMVGGFNEITETPKDWVFFTALTRVGARFRCVPEVTWHYQQHEHDGKMWDARELRKIGVDI